MKSRLCLLCSGSHVSGGDFVIVPGNNVCRMKGSPGHLLTFGDTCIVMWEYGEFVVCD